jgi:hypothetical protein
MSIASNGQSSAQRAQPLHCARFTTATAGRARFSHGAATASNVTAATAIQSPCGDSHGISAWGKRKNQSTESAAGTVDACARARLAAG